MSKRKQKVNKGTLRRVLELIRPYAGLVVLTLVLAVVTVVTPLLAPVISGKAVDHIIGPGQVDFGGVGKLAIAMAGTVACTAVSQWLMNVVNNRITFHVVRDMRVRAFEQLELNSSPEIVMEAPVANSFVLLKIPVTTTSDNSFTCSSIFT